MIAKEKTLCEGLPTRVWEFCLRYERLSSIDPRGAFLVRVVREPHLVVDSLNGIDDLCAFSITILSFIRVYDPKTPFRTFKTMASLDWWSRSIGHRGAFLVRVDMKISLRVDDFDGAVSWQVNWHKRLTVKEVHDSRGSVLHPIFRKP
jgi:hypothetical protein